MTFEEKVSGHRILYETMSCRPPDRRWGFEIFCQVMGYFTGYEPTLAEARNEARSVLERFGRDNF